MKTKQESRKFPYKNFHMILCIISMNKDYSRKVHSVQLAGSHPRNASCQKMYTFTWSFVFCLLSPSYF